ncbi:hypothetical protein C6Y40_02430 [Alteromonas alba]|uniref:Uncharacterized protein n=1 Tax=Alteromonas alba TaxID=2079529 RepID=A0A2S9VFG6_9ALTE|nr:hypothetical protein [Alteromonas alba]PRO75193.1 hypothetical protein C6Y40_02430 [Alteromonas alba]
MPDKPTYSDEDNFLNLMTSSLKGLYVSTKCKTSSKATALTDKKRTFADEAKLLLIIISGKDRSYLLWKPKVWTDWEYQEGVIREFFADDNDAITKVVKLVKKHRLACVCGDSILPEVPCLSPHCKHALDIWRQK